MPKGPRGETRPADVIGCAVTVGRIATGEIVEAVRMPSAKTSSGLAGAKARMKSTTASERSAIAKKAAASRWG